MDQLSAESAFSSVEFAENPEPRVPCVLLVDTSTSMSGMKLIELSKGLKIYREELMKDPLASKRVEVAIVTFGGRVERKTKFVTAPDFEPPRLDAIGGTPMGEAILEGITMVEQRKEQYRANGIAYYRPWIFLITDGEPNDHWQPVCSKVGAGEKEKAFCFFAVGVEGANMEVLKQISARKPLWLMGLKFAELFTWLSNSQQAVSRSSPGDAVALEDPTSGPSGWAAI
ncbi:VWA domain-containing protein [Botrimarina sp.]|uniref:vWA domain-containing protein n=1 Tax=Botrimarina sp. TaxID=2795802 RepID=UPI0032EB50AB